MKIRGYEVEIRAIAAHKLESELGVEGRFSGSVDSRGFGRYVPAGTRDAIYPKLPASLDTIHTRTDVPIRIFSREGAELYDSRSDTRTPGAVLEQAREARLTNPAITRGLRDGWREQVEWHRDLPRTLPGNPRVNADTRENLLTQRLTERVVERVEDTALQATDVDHVTRIRPTRIRAGSALGIAGLALREWCGRRPLTDHARR